MDESNFLSGDTPAPFPSTSPAEISSRNTFNHLIDPTYVKGDVRVLDKFPNSDGILHITDASQVEVGKIDIQLKTLNEKNLVSPKYQCERSFIAYCEQSILPVILIAVDNQNHKAYWVHVNDQLIRDFHANVIGQTCSVNIPVTNCIDRTNLDYVHQWINIINESRMRIRRYPVMETQHKNLQEKLKLLESKLFSAGFLSEQEIAEINQFLDHYNFIIEREFSIVRNKLYPDFWKMGIGIIKYTADQVSFVLYPVPYSKNEPLIKAIKTDGSYNLEKAFAQGEAIVQVSNFVDNPIKSFPSLYTYQLIKSEVLRTVKNIQLPLPAEDLAREYIVSFIDCFWGYLGFAKNADTYDVLELRELVNRVIPQTIANSIPLADIADEMTNDKVLQYNIDYYRDKGAGDVYKRNVRKEEEDIEKKSPSYSVTLVSKLYDITLLNYYISFLLSQNVSHVHRLYALCQQVHRPDTKYTWETWNRPVVFENALFILTRLRDLYKEFVQFNFEYIAKHLHSADKWDVLIYRYSDERKGGPPVFEYYHLVSKERRSKRVVILDQDDPRWTLNRMKLHRNPDWTCTFENEAFEIRLIGGQQLDFLFERLPFHTLLKNILVENLEKFFKERDIRDNIGTL